MNHVEPQAPRYSIELTTEGLRATVPARRSWFLVPFLCLWLVGWAFGEISAIQQLISPSEQTPFLFLLVWLAGWTVGGAFAFGTLVWQLAGREVIIVNADTFLHRVEAMGFGWPRAYRSRDVRNLRATDYSMNPFTNQAAWYPPLWGAGAGPVAFDYGARTLRLAAALDEAEAKLLVSKLAERLPRSIVEA